VTHDGDQGPTPVLDILRKVKYPGYSRDIVSFGMVHDVKIESGTLIVQLLMHNVEDKIAAQIHEEALALLKKESGFNLVEVELLRQEGQKAVPDSSSVYNPQPLPGVKKLIAISSGKGGVGKSTVAVNLACTAAQAGRKVGLLDADIYGPSLPILLGVKEKPRGSDDGLLPVEKYGLKTMSIGYLIETDQPLIWRGPILHKALEQLLGDTLWGDLDVLFLDLPPGTGDVQLTLAQKFLMDGALVVTTPQDIALSDVRRGAVMFQKVHVPVLGIIENMSYYRCPQCGHVAHLFGEGGGKREAEQLGIPLLGNLPLDLRTREQADAGYPVVLSDPDSDAARCYRDLWNSLQKELER
jgi:ATP-binding protein involved in chromosome partitioning